MVSGGGRLLGGCLILCLSSIGLLSFLQHSNSATGPLTAGRSRRQARQQDAAFKEDDRWKQQFAAAFNWSNNLPADVKPWIVLPHTDGHLAGNLEHLQFHWVVLTCNRTMWGRGLVTTLLSGLTTALNPTSLTLVWCDHLDKGTVPSLLYNLRMSRNVTILTMPTQLEPSYASLLQVALHVPGYLRQPGLPLLITHDNLAFADHGNARLQKAVSSVPGFHQSAVLMELPSPEPGQQQASDSPVATSSVDLASPVLLVSPRMLTLLNRYMGIGVLRSKLLEAPHNVSRNSMSAIQGDSQGGNSLAYVNCSMAVGSPKTSIAALATNIRRRLAGSEQPKWQAAGQTGCHALRYSAPFAARQDLVTRHLQAQEQGQSLGQRLWGKLSSGMTGSADQLEGVPPEFRFLTDPAFDTPGTW